MLIAALVPAMLVIAQPDLGSGLVYMVIACMLLFVAGTSWRHLAALAALVCVSIAFVLVAAPAVGVHLLKPYQVERLTAFLHPSSNTAQKSRATSSRSRRSRSAPGRRPAAARTPARCRYGFVPESDTDFIFAAVGEQYGFVGAGARAAALRAADLARAAHPRDGQGPVRLADRRPA